MTREHDYLTNLMEITLAQRVEFGDNNSYGVKGIGTTSVEQETCENVHLSNILCVPG